VTCFSEGGKNYLDSPHERRSAKNRVIKEQTRDTLEQEARKRSRRMTGQRAGVYQLEQGQEARGVVWGGGGGGGGEGGVDWVGVGGG